MRVLFGREGLALCLGHFYFFCISLSKGLLVFTMVKIISCVPPFMLRALILCGAAGTLPVAACTVTTVVGRRGAWSAVVQAPAEAPLQRALVAA